MKVRYSQEAIDDLGRVLEFLESRNPFAARRAAIDLQEGIARLKEFPRIGLPAARAPEPENIRDLYIGQYTVRYQLVDQALYILRVWHHRENEKN